MDHGLATGANARKASVLAVPGIVPTFLFGAGTAVIFFDSLSPQGSSLWVFVLFVGGALSITAFPVLARILQERGIANTPIGGLTLVAAAIDDAVAWAFLALIIAVGASGSPGGAVRTILSAAIFAVLMLTLGRKWLAKLGERAERDGKLSRDMTAILLLPVFFAFSGLNTQVSGFGAGGKLWFPLAVIMLAAFAGKSHLPRFPARPPGGPGRRQTLPRPSSVSRATTAAGSGIPAISRATFAATSRAAGSSSR